MFKSENDSKVHSFFAVCQEITKFQIRKKNKKTENIWNFFYFSSFFFFFLWSIVLLKYYAHTISSEDRKQKEIHSQDTSFKWSKHICEKKSQQDNF